LSLLELLAILEKKLGREIKHKFSDWRPGDQKVFVSDISKAKKEFGWEPKISAEKGVGLLIDWAKDNINLFKKFNY